MGIIIAVLIVHVLLHITDYVPVQQNTSVNVSVPKVKQFNINV
jgi:hypothetical protein